MAPRSGEPRVVAAEAEAQRGDRVAPVSAQPLDRGPHVRLDPLGRRLADVLPVLEVLVTLADSGGSAEVVDRHGPMPALGEPQGELLVEAVEPADIREDHDAGAGGVVRLRREGREPVPVGRLELELLVRDRRARDRRDRRRRVELEAHAPSLATRVSSRSCSPGRPCSVPSCRGTRRAR